ncbi:MAG TPA: ATP-binding protein [Pyrinomonadaceae bacterium]
MTRRSDLRLIVTFALLTFLLTAGVILAWENLLLPPFYSWVDARYPGEANVQTRWNIQQRVEHFFISITVDVVVVTLLVGMLRAQQRRLAQSEGRYRSLFEHARDGIGVVHAGSRRLIEANSKFCEVLGCKPPEVIGRKLDEFLRTPDAPRPPLISELLDSGKSGEGEMSILTAGGASLPVSFSFHSLSTEGEEELLTLIIRDLSSRKRLEAENEEIQRQLFQSSKLASLGELSAGVAHEINNPLNGIINFAQLLKDEPAPRSEFEQQMIDGVIDEGERIAQIVRGLLTFARNDSQELHRVRLEDAVKASVALFGRQLEKDGIRVEVEFAADLPPMRADASRLRQVVVNLISNAHHALREKPPRAGEQKVFRISARRVVAAAGVVVRTEFYDNGAGIRREDLGKVFDPFFTTRRETGGTGLGLSITFGIIRDHGGTITVASEEGKFTRFTMDLPAAGAYEIEGVEYV